MLAALADSLYILSQAVSFVNTFFHFSLQTEVRKDQIQAVAARSELVYYTALFLICQALFLISDSASQVHPKEKALLK